MEFTESLNDDTWRSSRPRFEIPSFTYEIHGATQEEQDRKHRNEQSQVVYMSECFGNIIGFSGHRHDGYSPGENISKCISEDCTEAIIPGTVKRSFVTDLILPPAGLIA